MHRKARPKTIDALESKFTLVSAAGVSLTNGDTFSDVPSQASASHFGSKFAAPILYQKGLSNMVQTGIVHQGTFLFVPVQENCQRGQFGHAFDCA